MVSYGSMESRISQALKLLGVRGSKPVGFLGVQ